MPKGNKGGPGGPTGCVGALCDWSTGKGGPSCIDGSGGCSPPHLCEAEESSFHDKTLQDATKKINRILSSLPADSKGRKLSFCETKQGQFLAWVKHSGKAPAGRVVTRRDDDATVAKALKLKVAAGKKR